MTLRFITTLLFILLAIAGCSNDSSQYMDMAKPLSKEIEAEAKQRHRTKYLAYEHNVSITISEGKVLTTYEAIVDSCANDNEYNCTILQSSLSTGGHATGDLKLRVNPEGVSYFVGLAASHGSITRQSTSVDDLGEAVVENEKRLEMLETYREKLEQLEQKSTRDIESLIKIASELSTVQSKIEYAYGAKADLLQRTKMDIVNIRLDTPLHESFWRPIKNSSSSFIGNLSEGISQVITVLAYLIPWLLILYPAIYGVRYIWRRSKSKPKS